MSKENNTTGYGELACKVQKQLAQDGKVYTEKELKYLLLEIFGEIRKEVDKGASVTIPNFGTFKRDKRAPRSGKNNFTGEQYFTPERYQLVMKASEKIKYIDKLNSK